MLFEVLGNVAGVEEMAWAVLSNKEKAKPGMLGSILQSQAKKGNSPPRISETMATLVIFWNGRLSDDVN